MPSLKEQSLNEGLSRRRVQAIIRKPSTVLETARHWRWGNASDSLHCFVVGPPRAGTTLVQTILRSHPSFTGLDGETRFFFRRNYFSLKIEEIDEAIWSTLLRSSYSKTRLFDYLAKEVTGDTGRVFVEKTPEHALFLSRLVASFPRSRFVFVLRDPRDAFLSALRNPAVKVATPEKYCFVWRESVSQLRENLLRDEVMFLKYEDLCSDPIEEISRMMGFLGFEYSPSQLNPTENIRVKRKHEVGHERLKTPISPKTVGKWRTELSPELQCFFSQELNEFFSSFRLPSIVKPA